MRFSPLPFLIIFHRRIHAWASWLASPRLFWSVLVALLIALTYALWPPLTERRMRWAGLALLVLGTAQGFAALRSTRKQFGVPSLLQHFWIWVETRPGSNTTIVPDTASVLTQTNPPGVSEWAQMGAGRSPEERFKAIEDNILELHRQAGIERRENAAALDRLQTEIDAKKRATDTALADTSRKLLESQTGGLWKAVAALVLIFAGTVLSGLAPDIGSAAHSASVLHGGQIPHYDTGARHMITWFFGGLGVWLCASWHALMSMDVGPWSEWAEAAGTIAVAFFALFLEPFRTWRRRPKLIAKTESAPPHCVMVATGRDGGGKDINVAYFRIWVRNEGDSAATKVEVFASALRRTDPNPAPVTDFPPMNLLWANTEGQVFAERISPGMGRHCDVCRIINPKYRGGVEDAKHLGLSNTEASLTFGLVVSPKHQRHIVPRGTYVLTVKVAAENSKPVDYDVTISFDGLWADDQEAMIGKHVSIKVAPTN